jgi:ATP-dependent RNA helicase RhlE
VKAIPHILAGRDIVGCAQTGTGKTAAFALPILQLLSRVEIARGKGPSCLILAPTRELAIQIGESFGAYGTNTRVKHTVIYGGVGQGTQVAALKRSPQIVIATPGRLLDLMNQGYISLSGLSIFVLDEADRMLDMGFIHDIKRVIAALPRVRQTLLFSATMPAEIRELSQRLLRDPVKVDVAPPATTAETIDQKVFFVMKAQKTSLLLHLLTENRAMDKVLVFTRTKHGANRVAAILNAAGQTAAAIHGNKSQTARQHALNAFKTGNLRVLVASDIASRGIDIDEISHVVNLDIPNIAETYVHRIGRTGRAKAAGTALSMCDMEERPWLKDIERLIGLRIPVVTDHPFAGSDASSHKKTTSTPVDYERRENGPSNQRPRSNNRSGQGPRRSGPPNRSGGQNFGRSSRPPRSSSRQGDQA